jgi:formylmethanofuran dehydrogenase subunit E
VECKGCQSAIVEDQYRLVAEWPFCLECFERLRTGPARAKPEPLPDGGASSPNLRPPSEPALTPAPAPDPQRGRGAKCVACERSLSPGDEAPFGICVQCRTGLIADPFRRILEQEARETAAREKAEKAAEETASEPQEIVPVGVLGKKTCAGCARRLLEPGGYHTIDGKFFCPACAYEARAKAQQREAASARAAVAVRSTRPASAVPAACEACDRPLAAADVEAVEGFSLCRPCISVDVEAALDVARARHRARLRKLREGLAG